MNFLFGIPASDNKHENHGYDSIAYIIIDGKSRCEYGIITFKHYIESLVCKLLNFRFSLNVTLKDNTSLLMQTYCSIEERVVFALPCWMKHIIWKLNGLNFLKPCEWKYVLKTKNWMIAYPAPSLHPSEMESVELAAEWREIPLHWNRFINPFQDIKSNVRTI